MQENRQISYACKMSEEMQVGCLPAASSSGPPCQPSPAAARRGGGAARQVAAGEVAPEKNRYDRDDQRVGGQGNNGFLKETLEKVKKRGDVRKNIKRKHSCRQKTRVAGK